MIMPNWLGPLLVFCVLIGFIGFAFRQGTKIRPSGDSSEPWTGDDGMHHGSDGHHCAAPHARLAMPLKPSVIYNVTADTPSMKKAIGPKLAKQFSANPNVAEYA